MEFQKYFKKYTSSADAKAIINSSKVINEDGFDLWSFKKLIFLDYYIKPYLQILQNQKIKCIYIDFFSGCGANKIEGKKDFSSIGSPIISILGGIIPNKKKKYNNRFDKWYFIDSNQNFCDALNIQLGCIIKVSLAIHLKSIIPLLTRRIIFTS